MREDYAELTRRNFGIFSEEEQEKLRTTTVAIAGVGGIGGILAERLVRMGMENIKLSDPESFEPSNLNRQFGCNRNTLNRNKAEVVRDELLAINPRARVEADTAGIHRKEDADALAEGAQIVIDLMDYGMFREAVYLQRAARERNAYYMFAIAIAYGALVTNFSPDGMNLEEYNGFGEDAEKGELQQEISLQRVAPTIPSYLQEKSGLLISMLRGEVAPSAISIGANLAALLTATEAVNLILRIKPPRLAPEYTYLDLMEKGFL